MKKITLILLIITLLTITGCKDNKKNLYLPETKNDKVYTTIGGKEQRYQGEGYTLTVPSKTIVMKRTIQTDKQL